MANINCNKKSKMCGFKPYRNDNDVSVVDLYRVMMLPDNAGVERNHSPPGTIVCPPFYLHGVSVVLGVEMTIPKSHYDSDRGAKFRNRKHTLSHMRRSLNIRCHLFRSVCVGV